MSSSSPTSSSSSSRTNSSDNSPRSSSGSRSRPNNSRSSAKRPPGGGKPAGATSERKESFSSSSASLRKNRQSADVVSVVSGGGNGGGPAATAAAASPLAESFRLSEEVVTQIMAGLPLWVNQKTSTERPEEALLVQQIRFTKAVEGRLAGSSKNSKVGEVRKSLEVLGQELTRSFNKYVDATSLPMEKMERKKIHSMMTVILANKEILDAVLEEAGKARSVSEVQATWESHVRVDLAADTRVVVRCGKDALDYKGQGPMLEQTPRGLLVVTPVTLQAYQTCFRAASTNKTM